MFDACDCYIISTVKKIVALLSQVAIYCAIEAEESKKLFSCLKVTTLVNTSNKGPSGKKKGRSKKAHVLAASVEQATQNFLEKGDQIAKESQDLKEELVAAVEDVRKQGMWNKMLNWVTVLFDAFQGFFQKTFIGCSDNVVKAMSYITVWL